MELFLWCLVNFSYFKFYICVHAYMDVCMCACIHAYIHTNYGVFTKKPSLSNSAFCVDNNKMWDQPYDCQRQITCGLVTEAVVLLTMHVTHFEHSIKFQKKLMSSVSTPPFEVYLSTFDRLLIIGNVTG